MLGSVSPNRAYLCAGAPTIQPRLEVLEVAIRKTRLWLAPFLILLCLLVVPAEVRSQCNVTMTMSFTTSAPATIFITKTLSMATSCMTTAMGPNGCFPGAAFFNTAMLYASRFASAPNPYCNWSCGCGTGPLPHVTIGPTDGLPVELMDFAVEDDVAAVGGGDAEESGERASR